MDTIPSTLKDARKSWGEGDVKQEEEEEDKKKTEGHESKHRMKETGDNIIGQITHSSSSKQLVTLAKTSTPGTLPSVTLEGGGGQEARERSKGETYVSVHQLAVVLHLVGAVLVRDVALLCVLVNVGGQLLPLDTAGERTTSTDS